MPKKNKWQQLGEERKKAFEDERNLEQWSELEKWRESQRDAIYVPVGHGGEDVDLPRKIMPEGCSLTVIETCGGNHLWLPEDNDEIFELNQLRKFLANHPERLDIFSHPKENASILNNIFGSVAIYTAGEEYPNLYYDLELSWRNNNIRTIAIKYSGVIPLKTFSSPEFTTKNIVEKLEVAPGFYASIHKNILPYVDFIMMPDELALKNNLEVYKYSIFPSPSIFKRYFERKEIGTARILFDRSDNKSKPANSLDEEKLFERSYEAKKVFKSDMFWNADLTKREGYFNVSLETLMNRFPGHYYHLVCRGVENDSREEQSILSTVDEIYRKRLPLLSPEQKAREIGRIIELPKFRRSFANARSTKKTSNIRLAGLLKLRAQNQLLSKVPRREGGTRRKRSGRRKTRRNT
jgi:hypothetical protein